MDVGKQEEPAHSRADVFVCRAPVEMRGPWPRRSALPLAGKAPRRLSRRVRSPLSSGSYWEGELPTPAPGGDSHTNISLTTFKNREAL